MKVLAQKGTVNTPWGIPESRVVWMLEPRDCWIGFYWKTDREMCWFELYVTIVPMLPVKLTWRLPSHPEVRNGRKAEQRRAGQVPDRRPPQR